MSAHDGYHIWEYNESETAIFLKTSRGRASGERAFWRTRSGARRWAERSERVDGRYIIQRCRCGPVPGKGNVGMVDHGDPED